MAKPHFKIFLKIVYSFLTWTHLFVIDPCTPFKMQTPAHYCSLNTVPLYTQ